MSFFQKYSKWIIAFVFACAVIFVYKAFDNIANILSGIGTVLAAFKPFFAAFVIAYVLNMPTKSINNLLRKSKKKIISAHSYGISVAVTYIVALAVVIILIAAILPELYDNIMEIYKNTPGYIKSVEAFINDLEILKLFDFGSGDGIDLSSGIESMWGKIDFTEFGKYAQGVVSITSGVFDVFIAIVASVYMLLDKEHLLSLCKKFVHLIFKSETSERILSYAVKVNEIFLNYIYSRLTCGIITGIIAGIALTILQVKYVVALAILIGLMDLIPYFGSIIACVVSIFIALVTGGLWKAVWTTVVLFVIQQFDGNVLAPKIMSESLEIRPIAIILAVSVGGSLFGFWGMFLSVPLIAAVKGAIPEFMNDKGNKKGTEE